MPLIPPHLAGSYRVLSFVLLWLLALVCIILGSFTPVYTPFNLGPPSAIPSIVAYGLLALLETTWLFWAYQPTARLGHALRLGSFVLWATPWSVFGIGLVDAGAIPLAHALWLAVVLLGIGVRGGLQVFRAVNRDRGAV